MTLMSETFDRQIPRKSFMVDPRLLLLISAGCLVPAVLALLQEYVQARLRGRAPRWQDLVFLASDWLFLAVLTPIPSYLGTRFQVRSRTVTLAAHIAGAVAFCLIWSAFGVGLGWLVHRYPAVGPLWPAYLNWTLIAMPFSVLMYFGVLGCVYAFSYFVQIQEREAYAERLTAQLAEARLGALRMQLNPHFLFNSLNALLVLVREQNIAGSVRMLGLLSDVLHQVLSADQRQQVLFGDKLKFLEQYFAIEQVRFSDRLRVNWNIDERARLAYVPSFLLQPLVENAIKHGITKRADSGRIDISAHVLGDRLELSVRDDGVGVKSSYAEGVGLSNTRERLRTLYGNDGSLSITPAAEGRDGSNFAYSISSKDAMKTIRAMIVDDEPLARRGIKQLLAPHKDVEVTGEARNGKEALRVLRSGPSVDLLFLDVQMPELDGFAVLRQLDAEKLPAVIFVTAFDTFAVRAFEAHALDYLVKPVHEARFENALERVRDGLLSKQALETSRKLSHLLKTNALSAPEPLAKPDLAQRLVVVSNGGHLIIDVSEVEWIEAEDYYAAIHIGRRRHLIRESLTSLEARLDPSQFVRIHRSALVNLAHVREIKSPMLGMTSLILRDGIELPLSRRRRAQVAAAIRCFAG